MTALGQTEKNSVRAYVFRFALELGHCSTQSACLKGANNGLMHRSKPCRHSIASSAWASSNCGTSRPSEKALTPSHPRLPSTSWYQFSAVLKSQTRYDRNEVFLPLASSRNTALQRPQRMA